MKIAMKHLPCRPTLCVFYVNIICRKDCLETKLAIHHSTAVAVINSSKKHDEALLKIRFVAVERHELQVSVGFYKQRIHVDIT